MRKTVKGKEINLAELGNKNNIIDNPKFHQDSRRGCVEISMQIFPLKKTLYRH